MVTEKEMAIIIVSPTMTRTGWKSWQESVAERRPPTSVVTTTSTTCTNLAANKSNMPDLDSSLLKMAVWSTIAEETAVALRHQSA